jgi:O-antigen/teichoic acid export membrane protein
MMQEASEPQLKTVDIKDHPDLYRKSIKGGYWVIFLRLTMIVLSFGKTFVIANFFNLENLGIISIALMMMEVLSTFTQTGFDSALIQKKGDIKDYLNTAWTAGLIKGVTLFLILYYAAPLLASIRVPEDKVSLTISILRVMSVCFLIRGIQNIGIIYFPKELDFRKVFTMTFASSMTDILLSLTFIYFFRSIWGVIAARMIAETIYCAGSYLLSAYRPRIHFEPAKARELWRFGKWIYGQSILGYLLEWGDNFFVWFYLGLPQLALYKYAYNFSTMPAAHIAQVVSTVSFPAYSKIQDDIPRLREAYLKIFKLTCFLAIPISFQILILGPDFVRLFLKEDLHPMTLAFQILALKGLLQTTGVTRGPLLTGMGRPNVNWHLQWIRLAILAVTIYPLTKMWGIVGTAVSTVLVSLLIKPFGFSIVHKMLKCAFWEHISPSIIPIFASCMMCLAIIGLKYLGAGAGYIMFFVQVVAGLLIYLLSLSIIDYYAKSGILKLAGEPLTLFREKIGF